MHKKCNYSNESVFMTEISNIVYICYVDYEKAFDRVNWTKLMMILKNVGVDWRDHKLIWNLYRGQSASVQIGNDLTSACQIERCQTGLLIISTAVYYS